MKNLIALDEFSNESIMYLKTKFVEIASDIIKKKFIVNEHNKELINDLFYYFLGNEKKYDLNKGLMLCGDYGVGKSTLFKAIRKFTTAFFPFNENAFIIASVEELINEDDLINSKYVYNSFGKDFKEPMHILVNEFGHDYKLKNYGSDVNDIIELFLMKRYDIFQSYGKLTHFTTNLGKPEILEKYPAVIVDRLIEMCNIDDLGGKSFRR